MVSRFSPPTTPNVDVSWRRSSVLAAPPMPRCCSTPWTWIRCHTGSQTCRGYARTSAASSTTPAGGTYQVIRQTVTTTLMLKSRHTCSFQSLVHLKWNWHVWLWWIKIHCRLHSHWDSACTCRTGRFLDLCKKWCVSSLVCEYLFIQLLPHLTSPPFVAELVSPVRLLHSLLYCCTLMHQ